MKAAAALALCAASSFATAGVKTARVIAHRMVLQRGRENAVWGTADAESPVTVQITKHTVTTKADANGRWQVVIPAMEAGGPHTMTVTGASNRDRLTIRDVLVGDVWVCSGQSNMVYPLKGRWRVVDADQVLASATFPKIRFSNGYGWTACSPKTAARFSAVGYFFARKLHQECGVPIGILVLAYNASSIEQWMPAAGKRRDGNRFRSTMRHVLGYGVRGFVWYQGESNVARAEHYGKQLRSLIRGWREHWCAEKAPFIIVQIAPYRKYARRLPTLWAQQMSALSLPNTGFVVTSDVGDLKNIHPPRKQEVGDRAAAWALANVYEKEGAVGSGPTMKDVAFADGRAVVTFDHADGGLKTSDGKAPDWFEIAGADGAFTEAEARIDGETVVLHSDEIKEPKAVRFGWNGVARPNLVNGHGLPARPFPATK
jgi:sialate O-acetylesterase